MRKRLLKYLTVLGIVLIPCTLLAAGGQQPTTHADPYALLFLELGLIILLGLFGRWAAAALKQSPVLGELIVGVVAGNIGYALGIPLFVFVMNFHDVQAVLEQLAKGGILLSEAISGVVPVANGALSRELYQLLSAANLRQIELLGSGLWMISQLGVIVLLLVVGLETRVEELLRVGMRAMIVAVVGVAAPFLLGWGVAEWLLDSAALSTKLFLAAILCATSVGITARVLKDLGKVQTPEASIILGAAVIDDVLGLIVLAVVSGVVVSGTVSTLGVLTLSLSSVIFLGAVLIFGQRISRMLISLLSRLEAQSLPLLFPLILAFVLAWAASSIGLATIVGAFAAGLVLADEQFHPKADLHDAVKPVEMLFAPVFFVVMGMQVNLATFVDLTTLGLAVGFTAAAIAGKLLCGLPAGSALDRLSIGVGMVPRGEVGLIFASIGKSLGVVTDSVFSAVVFMVVVTTLVTPPALQWTLARGALRRVDSNGGLL